MTLRNLRSVLRVANQEITRYVRLTDRRVLVGVVVLGLIIGAAWPVVQDKGVEPSAGLFSVAVDEDSDMYQVVQAAPALTAVGPPEGNSLRTADILLEGNHVTYDPTSQKSTAAAAEIERASRAYLDAVLVGEEDQAAAFPVSVNLVFQQRTLTSSEVTAGDGGDGAASPEQPGSNDTQAPAAGNQTPNATDAGQQSAGSSQFGLSPSEVTPPFPMKSLLYTFAYLIPLTFIGELYGGSVFAERVKSRGLLLLATPISGARLLLGKSLPYIGVTLAVSAITTVLLGAGLVGFLASLPIIGFALAASLLIGILAPSQRSLTFLLVSTNVLLSTFLFLPAIFTEVPPVAYLSPVGLIAGSIRGEAIGLGELMYGTVPLALITLTVVLLSVALFREETLFSPGGATTKLVDGVDRLARSRKGLLAAGVLAVPIALALELFVLVFAVTLGLAAAFVVFLLGSAFVEEALKAIPGYANATRGATRGAALAPALVGSLVGAGFFLGEKGVVGLGVLGFGLLPRGSEALATYGVSSTPWLILAPLVLHAVTASISAAGSRRGRSGLAVGWLGAGLLHALYNAVVIWWVSGGSVPW